MCPNRDPRWNHDGGCPKIFIGAYSREDARRVVEEYAGAKPSVAELRDYFSDCWGNAMNLVEPERGLWVQWDPLLPVERLL